MRWTHARARPTISGMKLYFSPLACSLACRITVYETGARCALVEVDPTTKRAEDGADFARINPLGLVPALETDDGAILTENAAVLQYLADRAPDAGLAPTDPAGRARLHQWLSFVGTELHKALYYPLLDKSATPGAREYALSRAGSRLDHVARALEGRTTLLDRFSIADAYLFAVLNWSVVTPIDLGRWPALAAFVKACLARPAVARAFDEEKALWIAEQSRTPDARFRDVISAGRS